MYWVVGGKVLVVGRLQGACVRRSHGCRAPDTALLQGMAGPASYIGGASVKNVF